MVWKGFSLCVFLNIHNFGGESEVGEIYGGLWALTGASAGHHILLTLNRIDENGHG